MNPDNSVTPTPDEINFSDVLKMLSRHRKLIGLCMVVCLLGGLSTLFFKKPTFIYRQAIIPAYYLSGDVKVYLDSPEDVASLIKLVWLPAFLKQYNTAHPQHLIIDPERELKLTVNVGDPKVGNTNSAARLVYLEAEGNSQVESVFVALNHFVLVALQASQKDLITSVREQTRQQVNVLQKILPQSEKMAAVRNNLISLDERDAALNIGNLETRLFSLQTKLVSLKESQFLMEDFLVIPMKSSPLAVMILLSLFLGFILGVVGGFILDNWKNLRP